ncbi:hypothetical protein DEU56DRAFT_929171 [Suillus clintonianus]|uniref:uncharacterized protein n=1 Tax=Suillus clintonianus TaxID=1904413 RepID=UPI001B8676C5|nr:uncharacterized protein DEU56DRAFT_929171 [Suillus clintonianus]KAG2147524.1 hypothetical protein DEU56DRAFT_929171 [Suillus clintonianus]
MFAYWKEQLFGIEHDENALANWLQERGPVTLSDSLFITTVVLFGLVDSHDLAGLLEVALEEVETQIPLHQEEENCSVNYVVEIIVSTTLNLFLVSWRVGPNLTLLAVNPVGYVGTCPPPSSLDSKCFGPTKAMEKAAHDKCHAWLLASSQSQDTTQVASNAGTPPNSPRLQESLLRRGDILSSLPRSMKSWVDNATYSMYISACFAETNEPLRIDNKERFTRKEYKSPDTLMSIFHILDLKTQRAQAEADMFSEAIERTAEIELTDDGLSSGSGTTTTCDSRSPHDWFDDWFSSSSAPSNASDSDML